VRKRSRGLSFVTGAYVVWSLVPVLIAVLFSFNDGKSRTVWQGFSLRWWTGDRQQSLLHDPTLRTALVNSLVLALGSILITVPVGALLAVGLERWRTRAAATVNWVNSLPLVTPEIVMGAALLITFTNLFTGIPLGRPAQLIGHVTFSLSFVVVTVRARLVSLGPSYEEAARDLGATRAQAIRLVLLPLLTPAIVASCVIVFASSIDDFVISSFLSAGASSETVPVKIYSAVRSSSSPALNALATVMVLLSFMALALTVAVLSRWQHRHGGSGGFRQAVADVTQMDL